MRETSESRYRFVIASLVFLVRAAVGINWGSLGPLLSLIMREYGVSRGTVSWAVSITPIMMTTFAVPSGIIAAKFGIKRAFALGALLLASGILVPFCQSFPLLLVLRAIFGIGTAITIPLSGGVLAQWFSSRELPVANGFNQGSTSVGNAIAFFATVPLATAFSWETTMFLYALIALLFAFTWQMLGRERARPNTPGSDPPARPEKPGVTEAPSMTISDALKQKATFLLALSVLGPFCLFNAVSSWLPTYYHEVFGMPLATASYVTALFTLFGIPACILGGILPMRTGLRRPLMIICGSLFWLAALGCFMVNNPILIYISIALFGVLGVIYTPSVFTIPMELPGMTPRTGAVVLSLALAVGNFGGFLGPLFVGYLADLTGSYVPGLLVCCAFSLTLLIGGLLLPETGPKARNKQR